MELPKKRNIDAVIRKHSKTFYFATGFLPKAKKLAIRALYGFCRATDDLIDKENASLEDLADWKAQVQRPWTEQNSPILKAWALTKETYQINPQYENELIEGIAKDIAFQSFETWETLENYCYHVASTVGLLSMPIIGLAHGISESQAAPYAIKLGIALQLTNILRDVGEDLERDRVYLPEEDLDRFGMTLESIRENTHDARFMALMQFEIKRARDLFQQALPGIKLLHPSAHLAVGCAALIYRKILDEIEAINYQVFDQRAFTTDLKKLAMLPQIIWEINQLPPPKTGY